MLINMIWTTLKFLVFSFSQEILTILAKTDQNVTEAFHIIPRKLLKNMAYKKRKKLKDITYFDNNYHTDHVSKKEGFFKNTKYCILNLKGSELEFYKTTGEKLKNVMSLVDFKTLEVNENTITLISSKKKKDLHFSDSTSCQECVNYINRTHVLINWSKR